MMNLNVNRPNRCLPMAFTRVILIALLLPLQGPVLAQQEEDVAESVELEELRPLVELGEFRVKDWRSTQNETLKVKFHMYLALNKSTSENLADPLEYWKHRLRNQALIAIRLSERQDFLEPDLRRFREIVRSRINRLLKTQLVDEVLLIEFTMTTN